MRKLVRKTWEIAISTYACANSSLRFRIWLPNYASDPKTTKMQNHSAKAMDFELSHDKSLKQLVSVGKWRRFRIWPSNWETTPKTIKIHEHPAKPIQKTGGQIRNRRHIPRRNQCFSVFSCLYREELKSYAFVERFCILMVLVSLSNMEVKFEHYAIFPQKPNVSESYHANASWLKIRNFPEWFGNLTVFGVVRSIWSSNSKSTHLFTRCVWGWPTPHMQKTHIRNGSDRHTKIVISYAPAYKCIIFCML